MSRKIIVLLFPLLASCSTRTPVVRIIVPAHYVGPITAYFDQPNGTDLDQKDGVTTFRFSTSGTLRIKQSLGYFPKVFGLEGFDDDGHRLDTMEGPDDPDVRAVKDRPARMAKFWTFTDKNSVEGFVGTRKEMDTFDAGADKKPKPDND